MSVKDSVPVYQISRPLPDLLSWSFMDPSIKTVVTSHILKTPQGCWIIDPTPIPFDQLALFLKDQSILGVLLTNENHERAGLEFSDHFGCSIYAHAFTEGKMGIVARFHFQDHEKLRGGLEVIHLPGVTYGETSLYHAQTRLCIVGDALIHLKETGFTFLPDKYCLDPIVAKKSLKLLLEFGFDTMVFAHGTALTQEPKAQLQQLLAKI
jgi:glyoxylase-like metal-dependent hydrolase (beta-lactamase superfamily II)